MVIVERGSPHTLRYASASNLLDDGYDIRTVQERLGRRAVSTTMIYTQVLNRGRMRQDTLRDLAAYPGLVTSA